ncbi:MAG TPA: EthD domain-containing protein [Sphingomonas sp.]|nr:EthD domain-containing protein [Sphingomonas sp.]
MFKTLTLLKRRPDLSMEEFVRRYETGHAKLGERLLKGSAVRYVRRYLHPVPTPETGVVEEGEHDVVMEIWYPDRATWEAVMKRFSAPEVMDEIVADEETLFDRSKSRFFLVEEHETALD